MRRFIITSALACAAWSCVQPVVLEERPCPCAPGYRCCEVIQLCMPPEKVAALRCSVAAPPDAGALADAIVDLAPPADVLSPAADSAATVVPDADPPVASGAVCENGGGGLVASYFGAGDFSGVPVTRVEPVPALYWGATPPDPSLGRNPWSATFTGQLQPSVSETFTFALTANGGARLWLGGELLIDWWRRPFYLPMAASMDLQAGRLYDLMVEYVDEGGDSSLALRWESQSTHPAVIGQCHMIPGPGKPSVCGAAAGQCLPPGGPACESMGQGLRARYFRELPFRLLDKEQIEPGVSVYIPYADQGLPRSLRWDGFIEAPVTGEYTFYLVTASSAQMFLEGNRITPVVQAQGDSRDSWLREREGRRMLVAGKYRIEVDHQYLPNAFPTGESPPVMVHLRWKPPGGHRSIIPTCFLSPPEPEP
jgi:PA14 domain